MSTVLTSRATIAQSKQFSPRRVGEPSRYAALDLGSNSCRLLIARRNDARVENFLPSFKIIDAFSRIVRLGEGVASTGRLSAAAMDRTCSALAICACKINHHQPLHVRVVATEACRQAENGPFFLKRMSAKLGLSIEIISPQEEALLALTGCASLLDPEIPHALTFDVGGGSTEILWLTIRPGQSPLVQNWVPIPFGVANLVETYGDPANEAAGYRRMRRVFTEQLRRFDRNNEISGTVAKGKVQALGIAGTVTTLASLHLGLNRYGRSRVDGICLQAKDLSRVAKRVRRMGPAARAAHPCIGWARADLMLGGCAILDAIQAQWPVPALRIADRGVRDGILFNLMGVPAPWMAPPAQCTEVKL